jgi:hypothetical protein
VPRALESPPNESVTARFAVFRRSSRPSDDPPPSALVGGKLASQLSADYELASYYPAFVRQLDAALPGGRDYYVLPGYAKPERVPAADCLGRHGAERARLLEQQQRRLSEPIYCFIEAPPGNEAVGCEPFAAAGESRMVFLASDYLRKPLVELVPDGVASVRVTFPGSAPVLAPVRENAFAFVPPATPSAVSAILARFGGKALREPKQWNEALAKTRPTGVEWLSSAGGVIRAIRRPAGVAATGIGSVRAPIGG